MKRVNIQYSVDVDEIPLEIENLINTTAVERLVAVVDTLRDLSCERESEQVLITIDEARQALYAVDQRLSDMDSIFRGYLSQKAETYQAQVQPPPPTSMHPPPMATGAPEKMMPASEETMEAIREQLASHKVETGQMRESLTRLVPPSPYGNVEVPDE